MAKTIEIADIKIGTRKRKDIGDIGPLVDSITEIGLLHPVVITPENKLIAGLRRIKAFRKMKRTKIPCHVVNLDKIILGERDENLVRKDFTESEAVAIYDAVESIELALSQERQKKHGGTAPGKKNTGCESHPVSKWKRRTIARVAKSVGMGGQKLQRSRIRSDVEKKTIP